MKIDFKRLVEKAAVPFAVGYAVSALIVLAVTLYINLPAKQPKTDFPPSYATFRIPEGVEKVQLRPGKMMDHECGHEPLTDRDLPEAGTMVIWICPTKTD